MNNYLTGIDVVLIFFYFFIILMIGYSFSKRLKQYAIRKYFIRGLILKLICGLGFAWVYVYYYGGGDTQMYYRGAQNLFDAIFSSSHGITALWSDNVEMRGSASTIFTQRVTAWVNLLALNSFWSCTLLFASLSFIGQWLLFVSFYRIYPHLYKPLAIATLFIPGVAFWSSGVMKDSLCMLSLGVIVYYIQNIFLFNKNKISGILLTAIGFYIIINLKAYIALALLVALALYALLSFKTRISNKNLQLLIMPIAILVIGGGAFLAMNKIGESLQRYSLENILETAQTYQNYHFRTSVAGRGGSEVRTGSAYTLGEINYNNPISIATKFPAAISVTFFRPFVWEVKNPVMLLSALESLIILIYTLRTIWIAGIRRFLSAIFQYKEILFCFTFALIFGFAVGFTTYNFGSLVRYKAPCIPFYVIGLILINNLFKKQQNQARKKQAR